jgi:hypothetical protein
MRVPNTLVVGTITAQSGNAVRLGTSQSLVINASGNIQLLYDSPTASRMFSTFSNASNAFYIAANGTASFSKVMANEYEITSVTLNEIVSNRMLVDAVTTARLGIARNDDTAMENVPMGFIRYE